MLENERSEQWISLRLVRRQKVSKAKQNKARSNGVLTKFTIRLSFMHFKCDNLTGF